MTIIARKMIVAGAVLAALILGALAVTAMAKGGGSAASNSHGLGESQGGAWSPEEGAPPYGETAPMDAGGFDAQYACDGFNDSANPLLTRAQMLELRDLSKSLREQNATKDEIREAVQVAADAFMVTNMESYNLTDVQIDSVMAKMDEIRDQEAAMRDAIDELRAQNATREEVRTQMQSMFEHMKQLRSELKDLLDEYNLRMPPIGRFGGPMGGFGRRMRHGGPRGPECGLDGGMGPGPQGP